MSLDKNTLGQAIFVVGLQHGDEGKGKIVDLLTKGVSAVARGNGGSNAGHTIVLANGQVLALHQLPSGVSYPSKLNVIGHGTLVDPIKLLVEIEDAESKGLKITPENLAVSDMAHMVLPHHKELDAAREAGSNAQGSTKAGIAYAASEKSLREGIRVEAILDLSEEELTDYAAKRMPKTPGFQTSAEEFADAALKLKSFVKDTPALLNAILNRGEDVLVEGAQAYGLDINHGKYPYTTSTGTTVAALIDGTGINPKRAGKVIGVAKATPSKVGGGSFVSRITDETVALATRGKQGEIDGEYGATTGRQREVGYLDLVLLKRAIQINGVDEIALTKFDCLKRHGVNTKIVVAYELDGKRLEIPPNSDFKLARCTPVFEEFATWEDDTSAEASKYLNFIEEYLATPVGIVSNGPGRDQVIIRS